MKYEAVFGDQSLFDGASKEAVLVISDMTPCAPTIEFFEDDKLNFETADVDSRRLKVAMRRIIQEPKRWTVEDQKAGQLPEVGSLVMVEEVEAENNIFEFAGVCAGSKRFAVKDITDGLLYFYSKEMIVPIETQEERAKREEDEFVSLVEFEYNKMPNEISFRAGIRAAYRKLKGGE